MIVIEVVKNLFEHVDIPFATLGGDVLFAVEVDVFFLSEAAFHFFFGGLASVAFGDSEGASAPSVLSGVAAHAYVSLPNNKS